MHELDRGRTGYRHVACLVDRSGGSRRALREARRLTDGGSARLTAVHVDPWVPLALSCSVWVPDLAELRECAMAWLLEELAVLEADDAAPVVLDSPAAVCDWARRRNVDLIVAPRSGGALRRLLGYDISAHLTRRAPCPVLIVDDDPSRTGEPSVAMLPAASA